MKQSRGQATRAQADRKVSRSTNALRLSSSIKAPPDIPQLPSERSMARTCCSSSRIRDCVHVCLLLNFSEQTETVRSQMLA
jgi:hypothetical protein